MSYDSDIISKDATLVGGLYCANYLASKQKSVENVCNPRGVELFYSFFLCAID